MMFLNRPRIPRKIYSVTRRSSRFEEKKMSEGEAVPSPQRRNTTIRHGAGAMRRRSLKGASSGEKGEKGDGGGDGTESTESESIKSKAKRNARKMFKSIKRVTKKKEQVSFANDAFFMTHGDAILEFDAGEEGAGRAPGTEALYVDQLTAAEIEELEAKIAKEDAKDDARQLRRVSMVSMNSESGEEEEDAAMKQAGVRGWRRVSTIETLVLDVSPGLTFGEFDEDYFTELDAEQAEAAATGTPAGAAAAPAGAAAAAAAAPAGNTRGTASAGLAAKDMLMTTAQRLEIMAMVRDRGLSVDEAMALVEKQERELLSNGAATPAEDKVAPARPAPPAASAATDAGPAVPTDAMADDGSTRPSKRPSIAVITTYLEEVASQEPEREPSTPSPQQPSAEVTPAPRDREDHTSKQGSPEGPETATAIDVIRT
eukprot:gene7390-31605_t